MTQHCDVRVWYDIGLAVTMGAGIISTTTGKPCMRLREEISGMY